LTKSKISNFFKGYKEGLLNKKISSTKNGISIRLLTKIEKYFIKYPHLKKFPKYVPVLTRNTYHTIPPMDKIQRMTKNELLSVPGFSIENHFGKITFLEPVDLTFCNLDLSIRIKKKKLEMFPSENTQINQPIPIKGTKINKKAMVTFFDVFIQNSSIEDKKRKPLYKEDQTVKSIREVNALLENNLKGVYLDQTNLDIMYNWNKEIQIEKYFSSTKKNNLRLGSDEKLKPIFDEKSFTSEKKQKKIDFKIESPENYQSSEIDSDGISYNQNRQFNKISNKEQRFISSLKHKAKKMGGYHQSWNVLSGEWEILFLKF
jgi:hypothetical protein